MSEFTGNFQYLSAEGKVRSEGNCHVEHDERSVSIVADVGAPMTVDFGDVDGVLADNYEIRLPLYTGSTIVLRHFGRSYQRLASELLHSFRERTLKCLLLEDLEELARFEGNFEAGSGGKRCPQCSAPDKGGKFCPECGQKLSGQSPAAKVASSGSGEIRLFKSNIAMLGTGTPSLQWRLADVERVGHESGSYDVTLQSGDRYVTISGLGKRTEEFTSKLKKAVAGLAAESAGAVRDLFPFLNPDQLQEMNALMREGRSAPLAKMKAIHPRTEVALVTNAVDATLRPYYEQLMKLAAPDSVYAGFKLIRGEAEKAPTDASEEEDEVGKDDPRSLPHADSKGADTLYWFFFPIAGKKVVAWEASSRSGRATYFFKIDDDLNSSIGRINDVLGMLNFRRRPIYLSDDELELKPELHRYAIAARRLPELRQVRSTFAGRAIHSTPEAWQAQVQNIISKMQ
jgi:hypothetical protein